MPPSSTELWQAMPWNYLLTIALETPILLFLLANRHPWPRRLFAGIWLTACTYPVVWIVLPLTVWQWWGYAVYLVVAETFAPLAECGLFWMAFPAATPTDSRDPQAASGKSIGLDCSAIVIANLVSFLLGGLIVHLIRS